MEKEQITIIANSILSLDVNDGIQFQFQRIETIREDDVYNNFRVHMDARYGKINSPMKIDIATGDEITPSAVCYDYPFLFEQKSVPIMAYTLETILAEKYETILRRNEVRPEILRQAIQHTSKKRGSTTELKEWTDILSDMKAEPALASLWYNYIRENTYASDLSFSEILSTVEQISLLLYE